MTTQLCSISLGESSMILFKLGESTMIVFKLGESTMILFKLSIMLNLLKNPAISPSGVVGVVRSGLLVLR